MAVENPKELFMQMLSDLLQSTGRTVNTYREMSDSAQTTEIKEALQARVFVSEKILATLQQCFQMIGEKPVKYTGRLDDVFVEDFRRELAEIKHPGARHLFILAKINHLDHCRIAEYVTLIAAADISGHYGVGLLLECCLADKLAFVERTRRLMYKIVEPKMAKNASA